MIRYQIFQTVLSNRIRFFARVVLGSTYGREQLAEQMHQVSRFAKGDLLSVFALFQATVERLCRDGQAVNLEGFVRFSPSIGGEFSSETAGMQKSRHSVYVNAAVSKTFNRNFNRQSKVQKLTLAPPGPVVYSVHDLASESADQSVTRGDIVSLTGSRLKFDQRNPQDYLRFVNAEDSQDCVGIVRLQRHSRQELVFLMPETAIVRGYFEVANSLGTKTPRVHRSAEVQVN